jgi:hypothetical protein
VAKARSMRAPNSSSLIVPIGLLAASKEVAIEFVL